MDQLISKITNLGYEVFGIFLPGVIFSIFLVFFWIALGPVAPYLSSDFFPAITSKNASEIIESIGTRTGVGLAIPLIVFSYFLGHLLMWIGRTGKADKEILRSPIRRTWASLKFRIPRPENSYDTDLEGMFISVGNKFFPKDEPLTWTKFYPVVKNYVHRHSTISLISLYQNKYTFHRSITIAAAALFWLCALTLIATVYATLQTTLPLPRWGILISLLTLSTTIAWGFSDSFAYNWKLFGNSIITESYTLIFEPKKEKSDDK
ncbi:hypothetical protein ACN9MJ_08750 [Acidovorax facilis]|uniref:hypothetical protein n=1 Tax=Acidovorax facilis TaxID=12917 RepID=UPI003CF00FC3